jgi:hypothetical protein
MFLKLVNLNMVYHPFQESYVATIFSLEVFPPLYFTSSISPTLQLLSKKGLSGL